MQISCIYEQGSAPVNEDRVLVEEDLFGVFDGATSLTKGLFMGGRTGGYLAAKLAARAFQENDAPLTVLAGRANAAIRAAMEENGVDCSEKPALWSASAAVVRVRDGALEWAQIGDCVILLLLDDGGHALLCGPLDHDRETLELWKKAACGTKETIHAALGGQIRKVRSRMNIDYGVLSGEPEALAFLRGGTRSLAGVRHVILCTDGLFTPKADPGAREDFCAFIEAYRQGGLSGVLERVRAAERIDPRCERYPRFKTHDDVAAVALRFPRRGREEQAAVLHEKT